LRYSGDGPERDQGGQGKGRPGRHAGEPMAEANLRRRCIDLPVRMQDGKVRLGGCAHSGNGSPHRLSLRNPGCAWPVPSGSCPRPARPPSQGRK
jgi:hypothetical protein